MNINLLRPKSLHSRLGLAIDRAGMRAVIAANAGEALAGASNAWPLRRELIHEADRFEAATHTLVGVRSRLPRSILVSLSEAQNRAETASQQWGLAKAWASRDGRLTEALSASQRVRGYERAAERLSAYARHLQSAL